MKKLFKLLGIIALAAVIGFTMTACDPGGGKTIPAKLRFMDRPAGEARSAARAAAPPSITAGSAYKAYSDFYDLIGEVKESYTLTKFIIRLNEIWLFVNTESGRELYKIEMDIPISENARTERYVDIANPVTIPVTEIPAGTIEGILLFHHATAAVFDKPAGMKDFDFLSAHNGYYGGADGFILFEDTYGVLGLETIIISTTEDIVTLYVNNLDPGNMCNALIDSFSYDEADIPESLASLYWLHFLASSTNTAGKIETIGSPGAEVQLTFDKFDLSAYADLNSIEFTFGVNYAVIPMTAINIPEDAAGVRVEVGWDLTDIIERREGKTSADDDDIFVLKNNFWDGLSVKIVAE